jgi:type I restriction enzyme, S subunit
LKINNNILKSGWTEAVLGECLEFINGRAYKFPEMLDSGTPILRIQNLNKGDRWFYSDLELDKDKYCEAGDLLYAWSATFGPYIWWGKRSIYHYHIWKIKLTNHFDKKFAYYLLKEITDEIKITAHGVAMPHITKSGMEAWRVNLPPLNEQRRIVNAIERLTDRSTKARAALADVPKLIEQFRQSVLAAAFRGDLTADWREQNSNFKVYESFAHADEDVKGWVTLKAEDVCNVQSGSTPKGKPFTEVGDIPYLKVYNIVDRRIDFNYRPQFIPIEVHQKELKRCITLPGDILMNIVGPPLGKIAIVTDQFQEWNINQALVLFRPNTGLSNRYLYYFLREGKFIREIDNDTKGSVGQVNISLTQCRQCLIPIPSQEEQEEIVKRIELMFQRIDRIYQQYDQAKAWLDVLDRAILAKAFRGELVPQDPNDEPAAVLLERIRAERETSSPKQRGKTTRKNSSDRL